MSKQLASVVKNTAISDSADASSVFGSNQAFRPHACIYRDAAGSSIGPGAAGLVRDALGVPGEPLDQATLDLMGPHFSHDLSGIRVHTDSLAAESSKALNANAYTLGNHIVFDRGTYQPHKREGIPLLAHELSHVDQQANGAPVHPEWSRLQISEPSDTAERQAVSSADHVAGHLGQPDTTRPRVDSAPTDKIHRDKKRTPAKKQEKPPTDQKPAEPKDFAEAEWEDTQAAITPELENAYQDLARTAIADAKYQIANMVEPYSGSLADPTKTFLTVMGSFLGGAGNFPNDPPLSSRSPFQATQTASFSGFTAGALTQLVQGALNQVLDTGSIDDLKKSAELDVEEMMSEDMSIDSPMYESFETGAMARMHAMFNSLVQLSKMSDTDPGSRDSAQFRRKFMNEVVRKEFGVHGDTGRVALDTVSDQLHMYLESELRPQLVKIKHELDNKKIGYGALGGATGGLILGTTLGYEFSKGGLGWSLGGAAIGLAGGAALGALTGWLFTKKDPDPSADKDFKEKREKRRKDRKKGIQRMLPAPFG
jgi:hypothetical protein